MYEFLRAVISFIFVLGVLVFIHELGHYLAARWRGVHVDVFSIGFGKPIYRWYDRVGTEWRICPIPLGGYVKPHGFEDEEDATEEQKATWIPGKTFHAKSVGSRAIIIAAGPIFNFLLAIVLFSVLFAISGKKTVQPMVQGIVASSSAGKAGVKANDIIIKLGDENKPTIEQLVTFAQKHPNFSTRLVVKREGKEVVLPITIGSVTNDGKAVGQLGIKLERHLVNNAPLSIGSSIVGGVKETWDISVQTLVGIGQIITGQHSVKELGGPLRIAQLSGQVAKNGFYDLITLMAILSINLGLINLFPIPILDGGRLVFYAIEAIIRRPVPKKIQLWGFQLGFALIFLLFAFSTYNDISQLGLIRWFIGHSN